MGRYRRESMIYARIVGYVVNLRLLDEDGLIAGQVTYWVRLPFLRWSDYINIP